MPDEGNIYHFYILRALESVWALQTPLASVGFDSKCNAKECAKYSTRALISQAKKVMLKILQARFQQNVNHEISDVLPGFGKDRGVRDQIANIHCIIEKTRNFQKDIYLWFIDYAKDFV